MTRKTTTDRSMQPAEFRAYHEPALEADEVKHGLIVNALRQMRGEKSAEVSYWSLGKPGECAIKMGRHSIVLGALDEGQCRKLAELTAHTDYPGVIGPDRQVVHRSSTGTRSAIPGTAAATDLLDQRQAPVSGSAWTCAAGHDRGCGAACRPADSLPPRSNHFRRQRRLASRTGAIALQPGDPLPKAEVGVKCR